MFVAMFLSIVTLLMGALFLFPEGFLEDL